MMTTSAKNINFSTSGTQDFVYFGKQNWTTKHLYEIPLYHRKNNLLQKVKFKKKF